MKGMTSAKTALRREMKLLLAGLSDSTRATQSESIRDQLHFAAGSNVAIFANLETEVQLLPLLKSAPHVNWHLPHVLSGSEMEFLPVHELSPLKKGAFGILEPTTVTPARELDTIVCPGLAFTEQGERLGQGGGFYDRALAQFPSSDTVGVCFDQQLLDHLPCEPHDIKMTRMITPLQGL